mmetsp:Transcript_98260/g.194668  ORF Transcript_98260/g.194668 Transcript_98260/m.194668 type:complete len:428 (+) Transcript_98260:74-1357(+)
MAGGDAVADSKHRWSSVPTSDSESKDADVSKKRRRTVFGSLRGLLLDIPRGAKRRQKDLLVGGSLVLFLCVSYAFATVNLLQPPDSSLTRFMSALGHALLLYVLACAFGVIIHGPGRVPTKRPSTQLQPVISEALDCARFNRSRPFKAADGWCFDCNVFKPALAHHCVVCGACSMWMDHHCMLLGQCVGFRNMRCFLMFSSSIQVLLAFLIVNALRRLIVDVPLDFWLVVRLIAFGGGWSYGLRVANSHLRFTLLKVRLGWPSGVQLTKFTDVATYAQEIVINSSGMPGASFQALQQANSRILWPQGGLRGLFATNGTSVASLEIVFGEPFSWRWFVPGVAGGRGDPLRPTHYNSDACEAWAGLAAALDNHHETMREVHKLMALQEQMERKAVDEWSSRVQALVDGAEKLTMESSIEARARAEAVFE